MDETAADEVLLSKLFSALSAWKAKKANLTAWKKFSTEETASNDAAEDEVREREGEKDGGREGGCFLFFFGCRSIRCTNPLPSLSPPPLFPPSRSCSPSCGPCWP